VSDEALGNADAQFEFAKRFQHPVEIVVGKTQGERHPRFAFGAKFLDQADVAVAQVGAGFEQLNVFTVHVAV